MIPILIFACCSCSTDPDMIHVLFFKSTDGNLTHFKMVCLNCGNKSKIFEDLDGCLELKELEKEVLDFIDASTPFFSDFLYKNHILLTKPPGGEDEKNC